MHKSEQEQKAIKQLVELKKVEYDEFDKMYYLTSDFQKEIFNFIEDKMNAFASTRANKYFFNNINYDLLGMATNERTEYIKDTIKEFRRKNRQFSKLKLFMELELLKKYSFVDYLEFYKTGKIDIHKYSDYLQYLENIKIIELLKTNQKEDKEKNIILYDFFNPAKIDKKDIDKIIKEFIDDEGKTLAALIHLLKSENIIEIVHNSRTKGLSLFLELFNKLDKSKHEAVRRCFPKGEWNYLSSDDFLVSTKKRLIKIIPNITG